MPAPGTGRPAPRPPLRLEDCVNETCPWSGKPVAADSLTVYNGQIVGFCNPGCRDKFDGAVRHFNAAAERKRGVV